MKEQRPKRSAEFVRGVIWENERVTAMHLLGGLKISHEEKQAIARQCADLVLKYWDVAHASGIRKAGENLKTELKGFKKFFAASAKQHAKAAR